MKNIFLFIALILSLGSTRMMAQDLPAFAFYDAAGKAVTKSTLKPGLPVIVVYFDPDCDHCNKQASMIKAEISKFTGVQMLWVAFPASAEAITAFGRKYFPLQFGKNFFFARDNDYTFDKSFGYSEAPSLYVYNKSWKLVKSFKKNEVNVSELLAATK